MASLQESIRQYLQNVEAKSGRTSRAYAYTLSQFFTVVGDRELTTITRQDLIAFLSALRGQQYSDRSCANKLSEVVTMLRSFDIKNVTLRVKFTEKDTKSYRPDELIRLFAAATEDEKLMWNFYLATGVREQEAMRATWDNIDFVDQIYTVRAQDNWRPKDCEVRELPLPDHLVVALKKRMLSTKGKYIFQTFDGKMDGHMLRHLKALAKRAGLSGNWTLHQFRRSYATLLHRAGTDARTIQKRLGHSSLETTLRYLAGEDARSERSRQQVNGAFAFATGA